MPAIAPFVAGLPASERDELAATAIAVLGPDVQPLRLGVRILSSVVPGAG